MCVLREYSSSALWVMVSAQCWCAASTCQLLPVHGPVSIPPTVFLPLPVCFETALYYESTLVLPRSPVAVSTMPRLSCNTQVKSHFPLLSVICIYSRAYLCSELSCRTNTAILLRLESIRQYGWRNTHTHSRSVPVVVNGRRSLTFFIHTYIHWPNFATE